MAEIAGLVIGIVGVVGVIGAFKDTIDLFNDFISSREFGRDYEILVTKVDIERTILLQWADHVRLLQTNYDKRLDDDVIQHAVAGILGCIKFLMGDETQLKTRYGLKKEVQPSGETRCFSGGIGGPRMSRFVEEFEAMKLRSKIRNTTTTFSKKIRWIIHDKEKFEELVRELAHFTTKLMQIMPPFYSTQEAANRAFDRDVTSINNLRELKLILDASVGRRIPIAESTREQITRICQQRILHRLWFRTIDLRKESVSPAHGQTFNWALEPPDQDFPWDDLSSWLRYDSGIYWVSGKAGSGKSTLMKYLFQHEKTKSLLSQWAGELPCSMHHFFFWSMGTYEQKSQEGLSRALLYQILSNNRALIKETLPNMWEELYTGDSEVYLPSVPEIKYAFHILGTKTSQLGKFCFFIDGLDEFMGNYRDGIAFIKELSENSHVKVIVSSRPIPDCVSSFEGLPSLQLHHLTYPDIKAYVEDVIGKHRYMEGLMTRNPGESVEIMEYLVTKSSGVFLWVILACRSLLSGFADYDRIHELRRRVHELPPELEDMFQHMMNRIDKRHREQGSRMLRMCYTNTQAQDRKQAGYISSLGLALVDGGYRSIRQISTLTKEQRHRLCEELEGRLRSRTGGLLEIHGCQKCLYSATTSLLERDPQATPFLDDGFYWGVQADLQYPEGRENIFYVLEPFISYLQSKSSSPHNGMLFRIIQYARINPDANTISLLLAAEAGAINVVRSHIFLPPPMRPDAVHISRLLCHFLHPSLTKGYYELTTVRRRGRWILSKKMILLLLSRGADPNYVVSGYTPWYCWLRAAEGNLLSSEEKVLVAEITEAFIQHGADLSSDDFCQWARLLLLATPLDPSDNAVSRLHQLVSKIEHDRELKYSLNDLGAVHTEETEKMQKEGSHSEGSTSEFTTSSCSDMAHNRLALNKRFRDEISPDRDCKRTRMGRF
ncbi:prion-inhibition and propagation-domain-containing protein [Rostrohypoxylon terebratum]|nr:prion-inhibition and propagation-domain-containing protein [Rostrohypoxylon terebratum]